MEDNLSEKILFGDLRAGQIVMVDVEGTGQAAQFTFKGVPKPGEVPDALPAEIASESKPAAGGTGGRPAQPAEHPPRPPANNPRSRGPYHRRAMAPPARNRRRPGGAPARHTP